MMLVLYVFFQTSCNQSFNFSTPDASILHDGMRNKEEEAMSWKAFQELNEKIISYAYPAQGCPSFCGCFNHEFQSDCPRLYSLDDVKASAEATLSSEAEEEFMLFLKSKYKPSQEFCRTASEGDSTPTGGYCLFKHPNTPNITLPNGHLVHVGEGHVTASPRIVWEVVELLKIEGAKSLSDFGAGVGQFASEIAPRLAHDFVYNAYDGAGNIEEYTNSYIRFADLSAPLDLPRTDWVMSLEVGEHIPARLEGMFIRNLHRHNCKGIILSWGVLQQNGLHHINEHSNDYIYKIFTQLGYERDEIWEKRLRQERDNHGWFVRSSLVFRRTVPVC